MHVAEFRRSDGMSGNTRKHDPDLSGREINRLWIHKPFSEEGHSYRMGEVWAQETHLPPGGKDGHRFYLYPFKDDDRHDDALKDDLLQMALDRGAIDKGFRR